MSGNTLTDLLLILVLSFLTSCSAPDSSPHPEDDAFLFSRPYRKNDETSENPNENQITESLLSQRSCEDGRRMVRNGMKSIARAKQTFSNTLEKISEYNHSYMLFLRSEQDQLKRAGQFREEGMKQLVNGLFLLYRSYRNDVPLTKFQHLDRILRRERSVTDSIQNKRKGIFSDFEGIYNGLKKEAKLLDQLHDSAGRFLHAHEC